MHIPNQRPLEVWGGVECTINRVGDRFFSQLARNGHRQRLDDLDRFAELGLRSLRFPVLWEELAPESSDQEIAWSEIDAQLQRMRELGLRPIVGLLHHGSGPRYTDLLDPAFPEKLARFAHRVAERYPWIDAYTPVNEPLTTARFSGLYGHWYPHACSVRAFGEALLHQCRGVVLAMRAIRAINPAAEIVQTEDLGKTHSTERLRYQADYENARRWTTWDLLAGTFDRAHPMWQHFEGVGVDARKMEIFLDEPCAPDVIGVNYYVTGERFVDEDVLSHPPHTWGGNDREAYADRTAARARLAGIDGPEKILREACLRYARPLAVTEAHLGCTREEQMRWFGEIWNAAVALRSEGHEIRAVTAWSLLGAYDWDSLLTRPDGHYESGVFDLRGGSPRPTALAAMIKDFAERQSHQHAALTSPGWWRRPIRFLDSVETHDGRDGCLEPDVTVARIGGDGVAAAAVAPILITGGAGRLARDFAAAAAFRALPVRVVTRGELDITDAAAVAQALHDIAPWAVINCAGFSCVDAAEEQEQACFATNVHGAETLARACAAEGIRLLTFSSDFVFDGASSDPYVESDRAGALNVYGESKMLAERSVLARCPQALVVRPGLLLAPGEDGDFLRTSLLALARGARISVATDTHLSISYLPDLVSASLDLLIDAECGVWHLANSGATTPEQLLTAAAQVLHLDATLIDAVPGWSFQRRALHPRNRALGSERGQLLPPWSDAVERFIAASPAIVAQQPVAVAVS